MDFEKARYNMVEQQIRPWEVLDLLLLDALSAIPRERFVLPEEQPFAYAELPLHLKNKGLMLQPALVARLIQALALNPEKHVLEIGTGSGYATAILAHLAASVVSIDKDPEQLAFAKQALANLPFNNIKLVEADGLSTNIYTKSSYDAIYIGGAVHKVPKFLFSNLTEGGRLVAIMGASLPMQAICYQKTSSVILANSLFETSAPYLDECLESATALFSF